MAGHRNRSAADPNGGLPPERPYRGTLAAVLLLILAAAAIGAVEPRILTCALNMPSLMDVGGDGACRAPLP